jgi:hypothetical protein
MMLYSSHLNFRLCCKRSRRPHLQPRKLQRLVRLRLAENPIAVSTL